MKKTKAEKCIKKVRFLNNLIQRLEHRRDWFMKQYNFAKQEELQEKGGE